jgi:hypothetical protein
MSKFTVWFSSSVQPVRSGFYELDTADLVHFDVHTKTWGIWFPHQPGVRHVINVGSHLRWRGLAEQP